MKKIFSIIWLSLLIGQVQLLRAQSPGGVTGVRLWLKADAGTSTTTDGAAVATWQDNSGNGFNLASPNLTTNAALYRTPNSAAGKNFNFNPYIDMSGARGVYSSSATIFNSTNDNATIFTYLIHNGATGGNMSTLIDFGNTNPGPAFYNDAAKLWFPAGSTTTMQWYGSGNAVVASATVPDVTAKPSFYNVKWSGPSASQKNLQLKAGGKLLGSNFNATPLAWGGASASNQVALNEGGIIGDNVGSFYGSEYLVYNRALTDSEEVQVNSYLAIKYGQTVSQDFNGNGALREALTPNVNEGDYLASDGTKIWNAVNNASYNNNIAGIARDDNSGLYQKQSQSINTGNQVLIGLGNLANTNGLNSGTLTNNQFLLWGDNGLAKTLSVAISGIAGINQRFAAVWKVQNTGAVGTVRVAWPQSASLTQLKLLQNASDPTFASGNTITDMSGNTVTINGTVYNYADVTLANGTYFTLAGFTPGPGGVAGNLGAWWKADVSASATAWGDASGNGHDATAATGSSFTYNAAGTGANFNPSITTTGGYMTYNQPVYGFQPGYTAYDSIDIVSVVQPILGAASEPFCELSNVGGRSYLRVFHIGGNNYFDTPDRIAVPFSGTPGTYGVSNIMEGRKSGTAMSLYLQSRLVASGTAVTGGNFTSGFNGLFGFPTPLPIETTNGNAGTSEIIAFTHPLTAAERQQVNSYLALKYGITLDQTSATNYLASDGVTKMWDAASGNNPTYSNNIAGIARDDNSSLYQKQSQSINTGNQVLIGLGNLANTNGLNSGTLTNNQFLVWGDNGLAKTPSVAISGIAGINQRFAAVWKVQNTGAVGTVRVAWPQSASLTQLKLVQNASDPTFASGNTITDMSANTVTINGAVYNYADVTLANGSYFTLAGFTPGPGGVAVNLGAWWKADVSASATAWGDASGNGHDATLTAGAIAFNATAAGTNFNPNLTTSNGYMSYTSPVYPFSVSYNAYDSVDILAVTQPIINQLSYPMEEISNSGNSIQIFHQTDNNAYMEMPYPNRLSSGFTGNGGSYGVSNIFEGSKKGTAMTLYLQARQILSGTASLLGNYSTGGRNTLFGISGLTNSGNSGVSEIICFKRPLTVSQRSQVSSYLALKYGITLDQGGSGQNYINSGGQTVWTADATYKNNIAGIGRDDGSVLLQKQSLSVNAGNQLAVSLGAIQATNILNTGDLSASDNQFLIWGDDNGATTINTATGLPGIKRFARTWMLQRSSNFTGNSVTMYFPASTFGSSNPVLLIYGATAASLNNGTANVIANSAGTTTINGTSYYAFAVPSAKLASIQYFSFATNVANPGGVAGQTLWLKADQLIPAGFTDNATISTANKWLATTGNAAGQYVTDAAPVFRTGAWNFNPVVRFNLGAIGADYTNTGSNYTAFTTLNFTGSSNVQGGDEVRVLSMAGGANDDGVASSCIPVLGGNPLRSITNGVAFNNNLAANVLNGIAPGIATTLRTSGTPASGNLVNTLYTQWNGNPAPPYTGGITGTFNIDYYVLGGRPLGSKTIKAGTGLFTGDIPEVIVYNTDLTAADRQKINSYLAIKYGITMDQTAPGQNYLNSAGTVIWTGNTTYVNDITGIGRDDASALNQKQSKSINTNSLVVLGLGSIATDNATNTNSFGVDHSFDICGADNGTTGFVNYFPYGQVNQRMTRIWKVQETGTVGTVQVAIPASAVAAGLSNVNLLVNGTATFNGTATRIPMTLQTINGTQYYAATVDFTNGQFFTFGAFQSPSNILINPTRGTRLRAQ